jgi:hypothetical protein
VGTFVWGEPRTGIEIGATVPLCERSIAIEPGTQAREAARPAGDSGPPPTGKPGPNPAD